MNIEKAKVIYEKALDHAREEYLMATNEAWEIKRRKMEEAWVTFRKATGEGVKK